MWVLHLFFSAGHHYCFKFMVMRKNKSGRLVLPVSLIQNDAQADAGKSIGGYFEFDYQYALDLNFSATKYTGEESKDRNYTKTLGTGLSLLINFNVIPVMDIYAKTGFGFAVVFADKFDTAGVTDREKIFWGQIGAY